MDNQEYKKMIIRRSYKFSTDLVEFIDGLENSGYSGQTMARQLIRSGTSIGSNIVEAQAGSSKRDFTNFLNHALKSANETIYWLGLLRDTGKAPADKVNPLMKETQEFSRMLGSTIRSLKRR